jgi:hypothetical protein
MREILSARTNIITQIISIQEELICKLVEYLQSRIDNEEMKPIQPIVPIQMLISSFLSLLLLDQPLKPAAPYLVEIILNGIQTNK